MIYVCTKCGYEVESDKQGEAQDKKQSGSLA